MEQVEGKIGACDSRMENKMAHLETTVNTPEEKFTAWGSKGNETRPSEISWYQHDNIKVPVEVSPNADACLNATQSEFCKHSEAMMSL